MHPDQITQLSRALNHKAETAQQESDVVELDESMRAFSRIAGKSRKSKGTAVSTKLESAAKEVESRLTAFDYQVRFGDPSSQCALQLFKKEVETTLADEATRNSENTAVPDDQEDDVE